MTLKHIKYYSLAAQCTFITRSTFALLIQLAGSQLALSNMDYFTVLGLGMAFAYSMAFIHGTDSSLPPMERHLAVIAFYRSEPRVFIMLSLGFAITSYANYRFRRFINRRYPGLFG